MGKKAQAPAAAEPAEEEPKEEEEPPLEILEGDFLLPDGSTYCGEYILRQERPLMHGKGKLHTAPETFEGNFCEGLYKDGTFTGADGSVYSGSFHNNIFHGPGTYTWPDGPAEQRKTYCGMWQDGVMHGRGEFENFSFGIDRLFKGFAVHGKFLSSLKGQEEAKRSFLAEYAETYDSSAKAALQDFVSKLAPGEPADPKAKKGAAADEAPVEWPKEFMVPPEPSADCQEEISDERDQILKIVAGPFPDEKTLKAASFITFAAFFAEGAAEPGQVTVFEERGDRSVGDFDGERLKLEQLGHIGQGVAFSVPSAEPGGLSLVVLVNVTSEYHVAGARWKLVHCEEVPGGEEAAAAAAPDAKGKKK